MIEEIKAKLETYFDIWQALVKGRHNQEFFNSLKPVAVGWKVADADDYRECYNQLHDKCDRIVETWMNGRWISKMHLKDASVEGGIQIIKLMQRRPGSDDALGLDHVDFYSPDVTEDILKAEPDLKWSWESNDVINNYDWISIWFDGGEAKLKSNTVIDIVIEELKEINNKLVS